MSASSTMSLYQIRIEGWKALTERLGPAGAMRFMMQYDPGRDDYTRERQDIFADLTIDTLLDAVTERAQTKYLPTIRRRDRSFVYVVPSAA
jgi:hypothetical protein